MILAFLALAAVSPMAAVATIDSGRIAGESLSDGSFVFRGIPYAAPPVGPLRWKPPQPVSPWTGVRQMTEAPPACPQPDQGWNSEAAARTSEDCLYLDVRTPGMKTDAPLPVMVWIHGGGNVAGSGAGTVMSSIVDRGIVLVSIQYRLGVLGFMSHPALTAESGTGSSGNYGLMDQQAALRWVQANIARFGGDPANVTIFGESAGGQGVGLLLLEPGARGLFHKAIEESGTPGFGLAPRSLADNEAIGARIAAAAGARGNDAAALRAIAAPRLVEAGQGPVLPAGEDNGLIWLHAVVDGTVLIEPPAATLARLGDAAVPLIIGAIAQEFTLGDVRAYPRAVVRRAFGSNAEAALAFYGLDGDAMPADDPMLGSAIMQISSDLMFRCPAVAVSGAHAAAGSPVWQYHFAYAAPGAPPVSHNSELRYVFNAAGEQDLPADAAPLQAYWMNFARSGDPNGPALPPWPRYDADSRPYLLFDQGGAQAADRLREPICSLRTSY
jgi:para-nitrobenzyl esterase